MPSKVWNDITYPFPNFNGSTIEVWVWISNSIPHFVIGMITYPCCDVHNSNTLDIFTSLFAYNSSIHEHNTRQSTHYTPRNEVRGGILDSPCSSIRLSVCLSVCPSVRPWVGVRMITLILFSGFKKIFLHISLGSRSCMGLNISVLPH